jgi:hypothetical protein
VLQSVEFAFVRNEVNEINGIVTAADLAYAYGDMATPFFLIGELDQLLRHIVGMHVPSRTLSRCAIPLAHVRSNRSIS